MLQESAIRQTSEFVDITSKGRLWKILQDNGAFNNIDNNFFTKVREEFEIGIVRIDEEHRNKSTLEKSKIFIDMMIQKMKEFKYVRIEETQHQPYTSQDIQKSRRDAFDNDLSKKQADFNKFNAKPIAPKVDFADKQEDNSGDVNQLLEKALRDRENLDVPILTEPKSTISGTVPTVLSNEDISIESRVLRNNDSSSITKNTHFATLASQVKSNETLLNKILDKLVKIEEGLMKEK